MIHCSVRVAPGCATIRTSFSILPAIMFLTRSVAAFPLLWLCATAIPAGPGWWPNGTSSDTVEGDFSVAAYGLIDTYDGTNWLEKFYVEAVSSCVK